MPTNSYNFYEASEKVGRENSELNKIKKEFERKYTEFLLKYQVVGDKNFKTEFSKYPQRIYSEW